VNNNRKAKTNPPVPFPNRPLSPISRTPTFAVIRSVRTTSPLSTMWCTKIILRIYVRIAFSSTARRPFASTVIRSTLITPMTANSGLCAISVRDGCTPSVLIFNPPTAMLSLAASSARR
jgi:hypothetical protein